MRIAENIYFDLSDVQPTLKDAAKWLVKWTEEHDHNVWNVIFEESYEEDDRGWYVLVYYRD